MGYAFHVRDVCPACRSDQPRPVFASSFSDDGIAAFLRHWYNIDPAILDEGRYELKECPACGLIFQRYFGNDTLQSDLYGKWQLDRWGWTENDPDPEAMFELYRDFLRHPTRTLMGHEIIVAAAFVGVPLRQLRTLDFGMGWGLWARTAQVLGCESYGSELSEAAVSYVSRKGVKVLKESEIPGHQFHFVNTEQVFEHVPDPLDLLGTLSSALAPGGVVKISVPSGEKADTIIAKLRDRTYGGDYETIMPVHPLEHLNTFKRKTISVMADRVGLRSVRPSLSQGYAFLRFRGALSPRHPKAAVKELVRPWYQWRNPRNIYIWLQKRT